MTPTPAELAAAAIVSQFGTSTLRPIAAELLRDRIASAIEQAVAAERSRCAAIAASYDWSGGKSEADIAARAIAARIREGT